MEISENEEFWGRIAESYDEDLFNVVGEGVVSLELAKLRNETKLGRVIEFGCGTGIFTEAIAPEAEFVLATDISGEMVEVAATRLFRFGNVETRHVSCYETGLDDGSFDTGLIVNTIHLLESPVAALLEFHRLIRPGGKLIVATFTGKYISDPDRHALADRFIRYFGQPPYAVNFRLEELSALVSEAGFEVMTGEVLGIATRAIYITAKRSETDSTK